MMGPLAPAGDRIEESPDMETVIGIALVVISAIEIYGIVRIVSANLRLR